MFIPKVNEQENVHDNVHDDVHDDVHDGLTERQRIILDIIKSNDVITLAQMSTIVGVSKKTIQRDIALMHNIVKRVGGEKNGHWEIVG